MLLIACVLMSGAGSFLKIYIPNKFKKDINKVDFVLLSNYLGNLLICFLVPLILFVLVGYNSTSPYLAAAFMSIFALILHIRDITGKSGKEIYDKLRFTSDNFKRSPYMRTSAILGIICLLSSIIIPLVFK